MQTGQRCPGAALSSSDRTTPRVSCSNLKPKTLQACTTPSPTVFLLISCPNVHEELNRKKNILYSIYNIIYYKRKCEEKSTFHVGKIGLHVFFFVRPYEELALTLPDDETPNFFSFLFTIFSTHCFLLKYLFIYK